MSSEAENQPDKQPDTASATEQKPSAPEEKASRKKPETLEERLLAMDAKTSKKALHDSRVLKRLGGVFFALGGCALILEIFFLVLPLLPGTDGWIFYLENDLMEWTIILPFAIVASPAFGFTLRTNRTTRAQWLIRIVAILMIVGSTLDMINMVRQKNIGGFIGELVSVLISIRLLVISFNEILFGQDPPSHNQLGYVRSKWKAGQKPDHIPEHVHKPSKYTKPCFYLALLLIPVSGFHTFWQVSRQLDYSKAQEYFELGQSLYAEAEQAVDQQIAKEKYEDAYRYFRLARIDPEIQDVHRWLGLCIALGNGCKQNFWEAFRQLSMFPEKTESDSKAQCVLGLLYLHGHGTNQNIEKAAELLQMAARKGQNNAKVLLGYDMTDEETASMEPDYGGQTVVEYLKATLEKEAINGGKSKSLEEEMAPVPNPPPAVVNKNSASAPAAVPTAVPAAVPAQQQ